MEVLQRVFFEENLRNVSASRCFQWEGRWPLAPMYICVVHHVFTHYQGPGIALIAASFLAVFQDVLCKSKSF